VLLVPFVGIYSLLHGTLPGVALLAGTVYWVGLNIILLTSFVTRGRHGVLRSRRSVRRAATRPRPASTVTTDAA
jgi:hypothetical protein